MNFAKLILPSMEKEASKSLVMSALEAATGAMVGGTLGVMSAREGRAGDPIGSSDISGAMYGGVMGALAGAGVGGLLRSSAKQRGIVSDERVRSMGEHISLLENMAQQKAVRSSNHAAQQHADKVFKDMTGEDYMDRRIKNLQHSLEFKAREASLTRDLRDARVGGDAVAAAVARRDLDVLRKGHGEFIDTVVKPFEDFTKQRKAYLDSVSASGSAELSALKADHELANTIREMMERQAERSQSTSNTRRFFGFKV
tara:strand:- start:43 stop:810 length:768 start_codon:yes stop_codon:yes gene_type:complete